MVFGIVVAWLVYSGWNDDTIWHIVSAVVFGFLSFFFPEYSFDRKNFSQHALFLLQHSFLQFGYPQKR